MNRTDSTRPSDSSYDSGGRSKSGLSAKSLAPSALIAPDEMVERIAICAVGELFGGVERHILGMLSGLQARRKKLLLALFFDGEMAAQARALGIEPLILPHRNSSLLAKAPEFARLLRERGVQVVHVHGYKATVFCALTRIWYRCPMIRTEHGLPEPMAGGPMRTWRNRLYYWLESTATRVAGAMVCYVTEDLKTYYRHSHAGLRGVVIPNGVSSIDRHQFRRPPELREEWFNIIILGRLDIVKGHHFAIEAMAAKGISTDVHLHILGDGPCDVELRAQAKSLGIAHRVHMFGFRRNVYDYIAHSHALLMPSLHEGLPYTLLEAMSLATPIIASRAGGLAEVLTDDVSALLVPPRDVATLALAVMRLHNDRKLCARLAAEAYIVQQGKYSLEAMVENYMIAYRKLLAKSD